MYRPDIDGLRALAILPVVFFHAGIPGVTGGFVGVDVFFVISGFLIAGLIHRDLKRGSFTFWGFYERRVRRILPALITVMFGVLIAGYFLMMPSQYADLAKSVVATAGFASNLWFWQVDGQYFGVAAEYRPLLHTWSIAVEEQFYIVIPLLMWIVYNWRRRMVLPVLCVVTLLSFINGMYQLQSDPMGAFYLTPARAWELGLGAMLAVGLHGGSVPQWLREAMAVAGLCAIGFAVFAFDEATAFPGVAALVPCLGAAAIILAGTHGQTLVTRALSVRYLVFVGLISYSLYLWHWPILAFLRVRAGNVHLDAVSSVGAIVAALVVATASWALVERPFHRRRGNVSARVVPSRPLTAVGCGIAGLVASSALAGSAWLQDGLPERLDAADRRARLAVSAKGSNPLRAKCHGTRATEQLCVIPQERVHAERLRFLLWGDSHASAVMPAVIRRARETGSAGAYAGQNACAPLLGVKRLDMHNGDACLQFNRAIIQYLKRREDINTVILVARWALSAEGERAPGESGSAATLGPADTTRAERDKFSTETNYRWFRKGLTATVEAIRGTGRDVVLLGNIPEIGWNVPMELFAEATHGDPVPDVPSLRKVRARQGRADQVLESLAERPGIRFVPVAQDFCDPVCQVQIGERPIYRDDHHVNRFGAREAITPLMRDAEVLTAK